MVTALALALSLHAHIKEQTETLDSMSAAMSFSSMKWKPVDGRSIVVDTVRNHLPDADVHFTFKITPSGTALRASVQPSGAIVPSRLSISWTTYRALREVNGNPIYRWSAPVGQKTELSSHTAQCWRPTGVTTIGMAGQTLEAHLRRDDRELFSCRSTIEKNEEGDFVIRNTVMNQSAKDAIFEWGPYKETIKAGKTLEYTVKSAAAPKEADRNCSVSFTNDPSYSFKANAWISP